jgi:hypothetical protein
MSGPDDNNIKIARKHCYLYGTLTRGGGDTQPHLFSMASRHLYAFVFATLNPTWCLCGMLKFTSSHATLLLVNFH